MREEVRNYGFGFLIKSGSRADLGGVWLNDREIAWQAQGSGFHLQY